jgi:hypothetical protein
VATRSRCVDCILRCCLAYHCVVCPIRLELSLTLSARCSGSLWRRAFQKNLGECWFWVYQMKWASRRELGVACAHCKWVLERGPCTQLGSGAGACPSNSVTFACGSAPGILRPPPTSATLLGLLPLDWPLALPHPRFVCSSGVVANKQHVTLVGGATGGATAHAA